MVRDLKRLTQYLTQEVTEKAVNALASSWLDCHQHNQIFTYNFSSLEIFLGFFLHNRKGFFIILGVVRQMMKVLRCHILQYGG